MMWLVLYFYPDYQTGCEDQWVFAPPPPSDDPLGLSLDEVLFFHRQDLQTFTQYWYLWLPGLGLQLPVLGCSAHLGARCLWSEKLVLESLYSLVSAAWMDLEVRVGASRFSKRVTWRE